MRLPNATKAMQKPGKIKDLKEKIHTRVRDELQRGVAKSV